MMRKLGCLLMAALLLCCGAAYAEGSVEPKGFYFSDGETAYQLADGGLWKLDEALQPTEKVCDTEATVGFADAQGIALAVPTEAGYRFERVGGEALFEVENERELREFAVAGDCLLARWQYMQGEGEPGTEKGCLTACHMDGQEMRAPVSEAFSIAPTGDGGFWVADDNIYLWNPETDALDMWNYGAEADGICGTSNGVAYASNGNIFLGDLSGDARSVGKIDGYWNAAGAVRLFTCGSRLMAYLEGNEPRILTYDIEAGDEARTALTLVNCAMLEDERMRTAMAMFEADHPNVDVRFAQIEGEKFNTALMAREEGLDILYLNNYDVTRYVNAGVLEDLSGHPEVMEQLANWVDMDGAMTWKGTRFGIVAEMHVDGMQLNESLAEYLPEGLNPERLSWRDLMEAGAKFNGDTNGDGRQDIRLWYEPRRFPAFLNQYMAASDDPAEINFDTEEFRELMALYRQCWQNGALADEFGETDPDTAIFRVESISTLNTWTHMPLPSLEGAPSAVCNIFGMGVNKASPNRELALEFLADYASVEAQSKGSLGDPYDRYYYFSYLKDSSVHAEYAELTESERETLEENKALFSESRLQVMLLDFTAYCGDQVEAYLDGQIELDELIQNLQQRKQMVLMG